MSDKPLTKGTLDMLVRVVRNEKECLGSIAHDALLRAIALAREANLLRAHAAGLEAANAVLVKALRKGGKK